MILGPRHHLNQAIERAGALFTTPKGATSAKTLRIIPN